MGDFMFFRKRGKNNMATKTLDIYFNAKRLEEINKKRMGRKLTSEEHTRLVFGVVNDGVIRAHMKVACKSYERRGLEKNGKVEKKQVKW